MTNIPAHDPGDAATVGAPSMLGPIHLFGSACFFVFGFIYLFFIHSPYLFFSNAVFGALGVANWYLLPRRVPEHVRASTFLAIVYIGLVNVAVHLGAHMLPMVFWGMSVTIAAAFLFGRTGVIVWSALTLLFYPLVYVLKHGLLADRVIGLDPFQMGALALATYAGLLSFLAYSFFVFRSRLGAALGVLRAHTAALSKSEAFLAESQAVARIGSYEVSLPAGTWSSSTVLDEILGIDASYRRDIEGWVALMHPDDREAWRRYLTHDLIANSAQSGAEYRLARQDQGQDIWVQGRGVVQCGPDGVPRRMMGTIQDISGSRRAERERRSLESRLFQAQKLESLGVLAGGIAHDFNNLLTVILGNVSLAQAHAAAQQADLAEPLRWAETAGLRAAELTRQMLSFAGKGRLSAQTLDLNAELTEMAELLKSSVSKKIEVRFAMAPTAPRIVGDASQIRQIIMNLILNAAEAIGDAPGAITLRTDVRAAGAGPWPMVFSSPGMSAGPVACIEVVDTGCGMDVATQARVFEPFFSTRFTGRGLGLAAVLGIVKRHNGAIALTSAPNQGTTFAFLFPCAPENARADPRPAVQVAAPGGGGRVLVVDDEAMMRDLAVAALSSAGFQAFAVADGVEALEFIRQRGAEIDLVLLDLTMPKMDGVEVFGQLRRLRADLRVVMMSGYARGNVLPRFADGAPDDFLDKPFRHQELLAVVRRTLGGR